MIKTDQQEFNALLEAVAAMLSKATPSSMQLAMYFRVLEKYPLKTVRAAIDAHMSDKDQGRFFPTPAHIICQIEADTMQHVSDNEAWAIAVESVDENATIVWTPQIAEAWNVARPVFDIGDEVGARMAFKDAYARFVREANKAGQAIEWNVSEGFDKSTKALALTKASEQGRIEKDNEALQLAYEKPQLTTAPEWVREFAKRLKAGLMEKKEESADAKEKARTAELKQQAAKKIEDL